MNPTPESECLPKGAAGQAGDEAIGLEPGPRRVLVPE